MRFGSECAQMIEQKTFAMNAVWTLSSHLASRGSLIVAAIILASALRPEKFAAYAYFQLTVAMLAAYGSLGLGTTASRYFAEINCRNGAENARPLGALFVVSFIMAAVVGLAIVLLPERWVNAGLGFPEWLLAAGVVVTVLGVVPAGSILGLEKYRSDTALSVLYGGIVLSGAVSAWIAQDERYAMAGLVAAISIQAGGQTLITAKVIGWKQLRYGARLNMAHCHTLMLVAGPLFFITLMTASANWLIGRMILAGPDGEYAFALFSIGLQWYALALLIPGMISRVALPRLVAFRGEQEHGKSRRFVQTTAWLMIGFSLVVTVLAVVLGPWFAQLYGAAYDFGRLFIAAYMAAALILAPIHILGNAIHAVDGQWLLLRNTGLWFLVLIIGAQSAVAVDAGGWSGCIALALAGAVHLIATFFTCKRRGLL